MSSLLMGGLNHMLEFIINGGWGPLCIRHSWMPMHCMIHTKSSQLHLQIMNWRELQSTMQCPINHNTLTQCFLNVGPPSATLAQHWNNIGSMFHAYLGTDASLMSSVMSLMSLLFPLHLNTYVMCLRPSITFISFRTGIDFRRHRQYIMTFKVSLRTERVSQVNIIFHICSKIPALIQCCWNVGTAYNLVWAHSW